MLFIQLTISKYDYGLNNDFCFNMENSYNGIAQMKELKKNVGNGKSAKLEI